MNKTRRGGAGPEKRSKGRGEDYFFRGKAGRAAKNSPRFVLWFPLRNVCTFISFIFHINLSSNLAIPDRPTKLHTPSPTRSISSKPINKTIQRDLSPLPVARTSPPPPPLTSASSISDEPITPIYQPSSMNSTPTNNISADTTPGK